MNYLGDDGFEVVNGVLSVWDDDTLWACPINDEGDWNLYTDPLPGQNKCVDVKLHGHGNQWCNDKPMPPPNPEPIPTRKPAPNPKVR